MGVAPWGMSGASRAGLGRAVTLCVPTGVGVPLVLTYVYGTVVLSLCRSRWGCRGGRAPGDLGVVELDNLAKRGSRRAGRPGLCPPVQRASPWHGVLSLSLSLSLRSERAVVGAAQPQSGRGRSSGRRRLPLPAQQRPQPAPGTATRGQPLSQHGGPRWEHAE